MTVLESRNGYHILQPYVWPDPSLCSERDLFVHLHGPAGLSNSTGRISFWPNSLVQFDTYFNLFNIGKWASHCGLDQIGLTLSGSGEIELRVFLVYRDKSWGRLINEVLVLTPGRDVMVDLPLSGHSLENGLLFFEFQPLTKGYIDHAAWMTPIAPRRHPKLALSVTTFKREKTIAAVVERFERFVPVSPSGPHLHMIVVDNGCSAEIPPSPHVTLLENKNLGGAGGFARGLCEARDRGFTHCLFMDDDASTPFDAIERTWRFLAYATDEATAIAGAMIATRHAWAIWENGAVFDGACQRQFGGTDLRTPDQVFAMELDSISHQPNNFYAGWWFFAFPLAKVTHLPFPFFVRGDDVSFSLAHDFSIVTLPGVVSFQESFTEKDTPFTWYLDLRSHLAHHLSLPDMDIGRVATIKIAVWFWARTFLTCHYETMSAVNQAIEDVLAGPEFFVRNADIAERRKQLADLQKTEKWATCRTPPPERRRYDPHRRSTRTYLRLTLNGLLIPFFRRRGNRITLPPEARWAVREHWGAAEITYYDRGAARAYTVRQNKTRAIRESLRTAKLIWRLWRDYDRQKATWQRAYPEMTSDRFWQRALGLEDRSVDHGNSHHRIAAE